MTDDQMTVEESMATVGRRRVLQGAGAIGVAGFLAACGNNSSDDVPSDEIDATAPEDGTDTDGDPEATEDDDAADTAPDGDVLVATSDVPEGGGAFTADNEVVVTQPEPGEFKAFSTTCTHQGCTVNDVSDGLIKCPCHGSRYFIADGEVENGPAPRALDEIAITVEDDQILRA